MFNLKKETGGNAFYVGDCYIWSAIYYLDSPTDYREYLPPRGVSPLISRDDLVMLDSSATFSPLSALGLTILIGIGVLLCAIVAFPQTALDLLFASRCVCTIPLTATNQAGGWPRPTPPRQLHTPADRNPFLSGAGPNPK
jgi:hypothetical protein